MPKRFKYQNFKLWSIICVIFFASFFFGYYRRSFYTDGTNSITIWKPIFSSNCYIILGKYYSINVPKEDYFKVYASKSVYVCWNDSNNRIAMNIGSKVLIQEGFKQVNIYSHIDFFKKFTGEFYQNGKLVIDSVYKRVKPKYRIDAINL